MRQALSHARHGAMTAVGNGATLPQNLRFRIQEIRQHTRPSPAPATRLQQTKGRTKAPSKAVNVKSGISHRMMGILL